MGTTGAGNPTTPAGSARIQPSPAPEPRKYLHAKRRLASLARWLHTYLSMFSFAVLLFFAVTGFTLNHAEWFDGAQRTTEITGAMNKSWLRQPNANPSPSGSAGAAASDNGSTVSKLEIVEYLRRVNGVRAAVGDFQVDDSRCDVSFKGPGYEASVRIDRDTGQYRLTETRFGFFAVINDLHKGRDTGGRWAVVIDVSAIFMTVVSLTGLTLIFFLKRRGSGLIVFAIGALVCYLIYAVWVP